MNWRSVSPWGLVIALVGFLSTRMTVTLAAQDSVLQFLFAGVVPLVLGLSLTAAGVVLAVGAYDRALLRTMAIWTLIGTGGMAVLVALTVLGSQAELSTMADVRQQTYLSNFLIGGAVGGTLTGLYAARNRSQRRELRQQANRLILLNRLLRDKVINSATAIKGHADVLSEQHREDSIDVIGKQADDIIETVENIKYISESPDRSGQSFGAVDVIACLDGEIERIKEMATGAEFDCEAPDEEVYVRANAQLAEVFRQLLLNAVEYGGDSVRVSGVVEVAPSYVTVRITDTGPGLPAEQQALLERGEIAEFDDPRSGFGLNIVRLLVESFEGQIETAVDDSGTAIAIRLPREGANGIETGGTITAPGVSPSRIRLAIGASLFAGVIMWGGMVAAGGNVPIIGALYGIENPLVAIISHEFHSVVFGLVYAGLLSALPASSTGLLRQQLGVAIGLGLVLWLVAAGVVMPVWLRLVGLPAAIPMVTIPSLIGHVLWALALGTSYFYGSQLLAASADSERRSSLRRLAERIPGE